jgi:hypothetical protein
MDQIDLLLVLAQIGVGVAGFGSLATVVGQAYTKTDPEVNAIRVRGLLHIAVAAMLLPLVAIALLRVSGLAADVAWRIASVIAFLAALAISVGVLRRDRMRRRLPGYNKVMMVANFTIMGLVIVALGAAVTGLARQYVGSVYAGSIILMLVGASNAFILVVTSFLEPAKSKGLPPA